MKITIIELRRISCLQIATLKNTDSHLVYCPLQVLHQGKSSTVYGKPYLVQVHVFTDDEQHLDGLAPTALMNC